MQVHVEMCLRKNILLLLLIRQTFACCQEDTRIPVEHDTFRLAAQMPKKLHAFSNNGSINPDFRKHPPNSCLVFMSCGTLQG